MKTHWCSGLVIVGLAMAGLVISGCSTTPVFSVVEPHISTGTRPMTAFGGDLSTGWFYRPEAEGADATQRFGTYRAAWVQVMMHPNAAVAKRINRALVDATRPGVRLAQRTDGAVLPEFSDEHPADLEIRQRLVMNGPEILSVVTEKSYRPAGASQMSETTAVSHFDLKTGQPVAWAEWVRPADWPAVRAAALTLFAADVDVLLKAEFAELTEWPQGYIKKGTLWLLVRPESGSSAGETGRFYPVPMGLVRELLNSTMLARFGAEAVTLPPPGWTVQRVKSADGAEETAFVFAGERKDGPGVVKLSVAPQLDAGEPELLEWTVNAELNLGLLHYFAGWVGTLDKYAVTRVAVIDLATGKLLGCPPRSYTPVKGAPPVSQPVYRMEAGRLVVEDMEWGDKESFAPTKR